MTSREGLTFAQAEGAAALPRQLALREISSECSAALWAIVHSSFENDRYDSRIAYDGGPWLHGTWATIMEVWHVTREHKFVDEFSREYAKRLAHLKGIITSKNYITVFDFLQFLIQRPDCPQGLARSITIVLERTRSAYRVVGKLIIPITSDEEAQALSHAMKVAAEAEAKGPHAHLRAAATSLTAGDWPSSVRESISAVEGAAKSIEPTADTLGPALSKLKSSIGLNPALASAFSKLYGFTCGENGVRHALVFEGESDIAERDALFMFGACASFVGYLLSANRLRQASSGLK